MTDLDSTLRRSGRRRHWHALALAACLMAAVATWGMGTARSHTLGSAASAVVLNQTPTPGPTATLEPKEELERLKLREEVTQLVEENRRSDSPLGWLLAFAPFLTVIIGVITVGASLKKQSDDLATAQQAASAAAEQWRAEFREQQRAEADKSQQWREEFRRQQEQDRESREREVLRRFDETLTQVSANISSDKLALRLNAAASLGLFVKERYRDFHGDLLNILIANLKSKPDHAVAELLRGHLSKTLRMIFEEGHDLDGDVDDRLDLTGLDLYRFRIAGLRVPDAITVDLAFSNLRDADFRDTRLFRARGGEALLDGAHFTRAFLDEARFNKARTERAPASFHATRLVSATFKQAQLANADFRQAHLQGARFDLADLSGAHFEEADLADAYFRGTTFDQPALRSLALGARRWRQAHFDPEVVAELEKLSGAAS